MNNYNKAAHVIWAAFYFVATVMFLQRSFEVFNFSEFAFAKPCRKNMGEIPLWALLADFLRRSLNPFFENKN